MCKWKVLLHVGGGSYLRRLTPDDSSNMLFDVLAQLLIKKDRKLHISPGWVVGGEAFGTINLRGWDIIITFSMQSCYRYYEITSRG